MGTAATKEGESLPTSQPISENEELLTGNVATNTDLEEKYADLLRNFPPVGYRVLGIQSQSPASYTGLVAYFDFIVAANNVPLKAIDTTFIGLIKASEDKPLTLTVYNSKNHSMREVIIVPSKKWPGEGMLGVTIRFDSYKDAEDQVIRVLEVEANSPAEIAGLQPNVDYMLGTAERAFKDTEVLFEDLKNNLEHPLEVYVYNSEADEVRTVIILPTEEWGGEGILGASVAFGYLHKLPAQCCHTIGRYVENSSSKAIHSPFGNHVLPVLADEGKPAAEQVTSQQQPAQQQAAINKTPSAKTDTDIESTDSLASSQEPKNLIQAMTSPASPAKVN